MNEVRNKYGEYVETSRSQWLKARKRPVTIDVLEMGIDFQVETLEGVMDGKAGDFLIKGVKGELYPCNREIFMLTYDLFQQGHEMTAIEALLVARNIANDIEDVLDDN